VRVGRVRSPWNATYFTCVISKCANR